MPNPAASLGRGPGSPRLRPAAAGAYAGAVTARTGLSTRLALARVYVVSDGRADAVDLAAFAGRVFDAGADLLEVRDADLPRRDLLGRLEAARAVALEHDRQVVVHDDAPLAADFLADLLLLADDRTPTSRARAALHRWALLGRSCNSPEEIDAAVADPDVAFLLVGPGLDHIRHAAAVAPPGAPGAKPWFAAGGVTPRTLGIVLEAGARRVAVGSAVAAADDPGEVVAELAGRLRAAWDDDPALQAAVFDAFRPGRLAGRPFSGEPDPGPRPDGLRM